jgi:hypothetical protein
MQTLAEAARESGNSYWLARYRQRDDVDERTCDWLLLPREGLYELHLICPNGMAGALGDGKDAPERFFQFKMGLATQGRATHVIGLVNDPDGRCTLWAWDYVGKRLIGPFQDNLLAMKFGWPAMARPNLEALGVRL